MEQDQNNKKISKIKPLGVIYCCIACLLTILFVLWTGYYLVLLLIPVFIDIYITKYIPWGAWKKSKNPTVRKVLEWVDAILFALVGVYIINTFFFQNYQIPSSSLEKSLLVGDFLLVSKISYGARSPMTPFSFPLMQHTSPLGTKSYLEKPQLEYKRFTGTGTVKENDIVVFNYPSGDTVALNFQNRDYYAIKLSDGEHKIKSNPQIYGDIVYRPVDRRENYVKRCVGIPGDTISFVDDLVYINGIKSQVPEFAQFCYVVQTDGTSISSSLWDELGITQDDQRNITLQDLDASDLSTINLISKSGLVLDTTKLTNLLYNQVFLTSQMVSELEKKPFVLKVLTQNQLMNNLNYKRDMISNPVYPIGYYADKQVPFGDFPAIWIPKKGSTITFDGNVDYKVAAYERCIKNYEYNDFKYENGIVFINGEKADSYTFQYDYYFMSGDNRDNSADSRMWGFVPEDHIVGKPMFIWLSLNKDKGWFDGRIRWDRIFTNANKIN